MMNDINLDNPQIMSASEAAKRWGLNDSRLRQKIDDFPKGTIRKFGKQWVVTESGMNKVFGKPLMEGDWRMEINLAIKDIIGTNLIALVDEIEKVQSKVNIEPPMIEDIFSNKTDDEFLRMRIVNNRLVDGAKRLKTLHAYYFNEFKHEGVFFKDLPDEKWKQFSDFSFIIDAEFRKNDVSSDLFKALNEFKNQEQ